MPSGRMKSSRLPATAIVPSVSAPSGSIGSSQGCAIHAMRTRRKIGTTRRSAVDQIA